MITSRSDSPKGWIDPGSTTGCISCSLPAAYLSATSPSPALSFHLSLGTPNCPPPTPTPTPARKLFSSSWPCLPGSNGFSFPFYVFFKKIFLFCVGVQPISHVVTVSGEQRRASAIHIHVSILPLKLPSHPGCHTYTEQISLCYIVGPR